MDQVPSQQDQESAPSPQEQAQPEIIPEQPTQLEQPSAHVPQLTESTVLSLTPGQVVVSGAVLIPAGLWWRVGAFLIDAVVLGVLHQVLLYMIGHNTPDFEQLMGLMDRIFAEFVATGTMSAGLENEINVILAPLQFAGWLNVATCAAYFTVFHGMLGASLGKLCLGLTVLRKNGTPLGYGWAFLRYLSYFIVAKLLYTAWLIPFNTERRTLYDMILGTNVFRSAPQENTK
jgi:uncharacterized RDD family membrane protein YckC